jgi:hypothetical protein
MNAVLMAAIASVARRVVYVAGVPVCAGIAVARRFRRDICPDWSMERVAKSAPTSGDSRKGLLPAETFCSK